MNIRNEFTEIECARFRRDCNFTPDELEVFNLRVKDKSLVEIQIALGMSEATVTRRIRNIKKKIIKVLRRFFDVFKAEKRWNLDGFHLFFYAII